MQAGISIVETDARALHRFDESTTHVEFLLGQSCPLGVPVLVTLAFHLCCFLCNAVLVVRAPFPFLFRAGCGIRLYLFLYRFLIIAFLST